MSRSAKYRPVVLMRRALLGALALFLGIVVAIFIDNQRGGEVETQAESTTGLDESLAESQIMKDLWKRVEILRTVAIGKMAPDFTMNDPEGNPVSLSSLRGSILLVDFLMHFLGVL